jgi:very-short-patch-repair endonuclease
MGMPLSGQIALAKLQAPEIEYVFHPTRKWRFDLSWPDRKLAVEIDGATWTNGRHVRGAGVEKDCEKFSEAAILGWRIVRVTSGMVASGAALGLIERALQA